MPAGSAGWCPPVSPPGSPVSRTGRAPCSTRRFDGPGSAQQRVRTQEVLGAIAARTGSLIDARDTLSAAAHEAEAFDPDLAVTLLADAVSACFYLGRRGLGECR